MKVSPALIKKKSILKSTGDSISDCSIIIIPHAKSFGRYNVYDPSVRQSVSPVFLVSATPLKTLNRIS